MKFSNTIFAIIIIFLVSSTFAYSSELVRNKEKSAIIGELLISNIKNLEISDMTLNLYATKEQNLYNNTEQIIFRANAYINAYDELYISKDLSCLSSLKNVNVFSHGFTKDVGYGHVDSLSMSWNNMFSGEKIDCSFRVQDLETKESKQVFTSFNEEKFDFPNIKTLELLKQEKTGIYILHLIVENPLIKGGIVNLRTSVLAEQVIDGITYEYNYEFNQNYSNSSMVEHYLILNEIPSFMNDTFFTIELFTSSSSKLETETILGIDEKDVLVIHKNEDLENSFRNKN